MLRYALSWDKDRENPQELTATTLRKLAGLFKINLRALCWLINFITFNWTLFVKTVSPWKFGSFFLKCISGIYVGKLSTFCRKKKSWLCKRQLWVWWFFFSIWTIKMFCYEMLKFLMWVVLQVYCWSQEVEYSGRWDHSWCPCDNCKICPSSPRKRRNRIIEWVVMCN